MGAVPRWRGRRLLIAAQVTVSIVLLALAAVGVTQLRSIEHHDWGFGLRDLAIAEVDFDGLGFDDSRIERVAEGFLTRMTSVPDATAATVATGSPPARDAVVSARSLHPEGPSRW
jgi:hypothetical protein